MRESLLLICLLTLFQPAFTQVNEDDTYLNLSYDRSIISKNKIDTITLFFRFPNKTFKRYFVFDSRGNWIHSVTFDENGNQTSETTLNYSKEGKLLFKHDFEENEHDSTFFFYDDNGRLLKKEKKIDNGQTFLTTYFYKNRELVEEHRTDDLSSFVIKYQYDGKGRLTEIDEKSKNGSLYRKESIIYGSNGKIQKIEKKSFGKGVINYKYDRKKRLTLVQNGYDKEIIQYFYEENSNLLLKKKTESTSNASPFTTIEEYVYLRGK